MRITSKIESFNFIKENNLNRFPERIFKNNDIEDINYFLNKYDVKYYAIRDKSKSGGVFKLKVIKNDVLKEIKEYDLFSINVSSYNYINNQLLVGEIYISNDKVYGILSTNSGYSVRDAIKNPDYNFNCDLFSKELDKIPYFDKVYEYIVKNELVNYIVEFAYFDIPVGIKKEPFVIYEVRTDY